MWVSSRITESLWREAVKTLDHEDRKQIDFGRPDKRAILHDVLEAVEVKKQFVMQRRWKYKKRNGEVVILRDLFEKIAQWVNKFKEVGDVTAIFGPPPATLAWAGVRFLLQVSDLSRVLQHLLTFPIQLTLNDAETFGAMIVGLEHISNLITRYAAFENLYLHRASAVKSQLTESVIKLYASILIYLSKASRYYNLNTCGASKGILYYGSQD